MNPASNDAGPDRQGLEIADLRAPGFGPLSFQVDAGRRAGLHGPSGAGKSRLLRSVADLDPHQGEVYLDGVAQALTPPAQWRRAVTLLPAQTHWWSERALDHFALPTVRDWVERLALSEEVLRRPVSELSSGESQRAALLRVLANRPRVLLLDEPTANLDAENTDRVESLVIEYSNRQGVIVLWISHDLGQLERACDDVLRMEGGRLVERRRIRT